MRTIENIGQLQREAWEYHEKFRNWLQGKGGRVNCPPPPGGSKVEVPAVLPVPAEAKSNVNERAATAPIPVESAVVAGGAVASGLLLYGLYKVGRAVIIGIIATPIAGAGSMAIP